MSGTFMDGGSQTHGGHAVHGSHGGDGCFMDGGDHHHHHGTHTGGEGSEGLSISSLLGLNNQHHGFLAHLLGLDHDAHHHGAAGHGGGEPSQSPMWSQALQGMKLSNFFQGINVSANFWLAIMFLGFISWLFVVYWIRHHEPFANYVLGSGAAHSATQAYDRRMIAGIRDAFPVRTSPAGGAIYVPSPPTLAPAFGPTTLQPPLPANAPPGNGPMPAPPPYVSPGPLLAAPSTGANPPVVAVPEYGGGGARLKTIVNR